MAKRAKSANKKAAKTSAKKPVKKPVKPPVKKAANKIAKKATTAKGETGTLFAVDGPPASKLARKKAKPKAIPASEASAEIPVDVPAAKKTSRKKKAGYATAESMAKSQRSISVSEFFAKNRHLLGFDNPRKALLTTVKEAVDNALDACEEAGILPVIGVEIRQISETHFVVAVEDNGPGIVKQQIPNIFGKLLYGSKFHRLRMSRGQQGIGISAAGMYGLLTTGQPVRIISRTSKRAQAHHYELKIDTKKNRPDIIRDDVVEWDSSHGTRVEIELEAKYQRGRQSVDEYLRQTAVANPHVTFHYQAPDGRAETYEGVIKELPALPREIKPHPYGVELGILIKMIQDTQAKTLQQFFTSEFSRVSPRVAQEIIERAAAAATLADKTLTTRTRPSRVTGEMARALYESVAATQILAPRTDCIVPIGEEQLILGLKEVMPAGFYTAVTRKPAVYRGNPFVIEAAVAFGKPETKEQKANRLADEVEAGEDDNSGGESLAKVIRFANRVPLQYQQGACAVAKSVLAMNWRKYGLTQGRGALPTGDLTIVVHVGSVWVPFTSESKEAVASYPEILKEIRLALLECGRRLGLHIRKTVRIRQELKKRSYIEKYIPAIGEALRDILALKEKDVDAVCHDLKDVLERSRTF